MSYNPFGKPIEKLNEVDLNLLIENEVAEGYWVEYKSAFPTSKKIAKSIASFANTYGGWYFIGVNADKTRNVATDICGFSFGSVKDPVSTFRESIKSNIDPIPFYKYKLIELSSGNGVLVVQIMGEQETPFITRDGIIYRRISDSSDPVSETNRYAVDRLIDQGRDLEKSFARFCEDDRDLSEDEQTAWVDIFIYPRNLEFITKYEMITTDGIEQLLKFSQSPLEVTNPDGTKSGPSNIPFTSGQIGFGSVILRQASPKYSAYNTLSAELFFDGRAKFFIPLETVDLESTLIKSPQVQKAISNLWNNNTPFELLRPINIQKFFGATITLLNFYEKWYQQELLQTQVRMAINIMNAKRTFPFCDVDGWGTHVLKYGLPVQHLNTFRFPTSNRGFLFDKPPFWHITVRLTAMIFGLPEEVMIEIINNFPITPLPQFPQ